MGVTPNRIIAPVIPEAAQLLEHSDQRQPFTCRLDLVPRKDPIQLIFVGPNLGHRLNGPLIIESVSPDRRTLRTTLREILSSRQIALIGLP